jgi:UDP-N-acetylmuramyl tripeptide synthase
MRLEDARRLTGPNLLSRGPLVLAELVLEPNEDPDEAVAAWLSELNRMRAALGLPAVTPSHRRTSRSFVAVAFEAPLDELMVGAECAEWAGLSAVEVVAGREGLPLEPKRTEVAALLERDRNPRLVELAREAARRRLPFLWDDEAVTVGHGRRSVTFPLRSIPALETIRWDGLGALPVALVTGTNGKTTSTRLLSRMVLESGKGVGSTSSDGVLIGSTSIRDGDWTGPAAARLVLRDSGVEVAVLETARGGILRRGLATDECDAALITNITDDHLGAYGIDDLDAMAEVKAVVATAVRPGGRVVLNARDARLVALSPLFGDKVTFFADLEREDAAEAARVVEAHRAKGGQAVVARGGALLELAGPTEAKLVDVAQVPITFKGAARYNVENALGAVAMARALGVPTEAIVRALTGFTDNPGRGETRVVGGVTLFIDFAHNPDGVGSALGVAATLKRGPDSKLLVISGSAGDRSDEEIRAIAKCVHDAGASTVVLRDMDAYLRGREKGVVPALFRTALTELGLPDAAILTASSEVDGLEKALAVAKPGDVIALLVHVEREAVRKWLEARAARGS